MGGDESQVQDCSQGKCGGKSKTLHRKMSTPHYLYSTTLVYLLLTFCSCPHLYSHRQSRHRRTAVLLPGSSRLHCCNSATSRSLSHGPLTLSHCSTNLSSFAPQTRRLAAGSLPRPALRESIPSSFDLCANIILLVTVSSTTLQKIPPLLCLGTAPHLFIALITL